MKGNSDEEVFLGEEEWGEAGWKNEQCNGVKE